jgi:hypothetical protein
MSNPPWDIMQPNSGEFLAGFDLSILDAPTRREALAIQKRLLADPATARDFQQYQAEFQQQHRLVGRLYRHQKLGASDAPMGGKLDSYRVFAERKTHLVGPEGAIGMVVPSAFHANEGATGIRRHYLRQTRMEWCLSFENRRKLFDIDSRFKFALVVARRPGPTQTVRCGFYLSDLAQLEEPDRLMDYEAAFIGSSGGSHATLLELRGAVDLATAQRMFLIPRNFGVWTGRAGIFLSREAHMTDDAGRFTPIVERQRRKDYVILHEGKTIHQFTDRWDTAPRYAIAVDELAGRQKFAENTRYFRAACREIARSTDERTAIAAMLPPGVICGHTISVERKPSQRPNAAALIVVAVMNSFAFDWLLRQKAGAHVSLYILNELPSPLVALRAERFLAHAALRLSCNHQGFTPLWRDQLGEAWREQSSRYSWPIISKAETRWQLRAAMDAVVATAYGLDRVDYAHILGSFSHRSFQSAPAFCLAAFDALGTQRIDGFCRAHDPYFDIPPVTAPAQPVMRLTKGTDPQQNLKLDQRRSG